MKSIVLLVLGIILIVVSFTLVCIWMAKEKKGNIGMYCYLIWLMPFWGTYFVLEYALLIPIHSKEKTLTTEIRQELLNGKVISTDTIYKFTPKKK